jgi:PiT family inorganic phosphate transporter
VGSLPLLLLLIVVFAVVFDYINGFHDTANAIATVVSTRVIPLRTAIFMAAALNILGALSGTAVAETIAKGLVVDSEATNLVILAALIGAIAWDLITWWYGIPSSSSHALVGGLCGAALAKAGSAAVLWQGVLDKVVIPMVTSPVAGFLLGLLLMGLLHSLFARVHPERITNTFRRLQVVSAAGMAFAHGSNDAQKSMGIITMALVFYGIIPRAVVPDWVILLCATSMALGTASGGYRIMKTMGHKIVRLEPVHGFAAETSAAAVILSASHFGMPVSTTHVISGSIFGVGAARRWNAVRWGLAEQMVTAWVLTLPAAGAVAALAHVMLRVVVGEG